METDYKHRCKKTGPGVYDVEIARPGVNGRSRWARIGSVSKHLRGTYWETNLGKVASSKREAVDKVVKDYEPSDPVEVEREREEDNLAAEVAMATWPTDAPVIEGEVVHHRLGYEGPVSAIEHKEKGWRIEVSLPKLHATVCGYWGRDFFGRTL